MIVCLIRLEGAGRQRDSLRMLVSKLESLLPAPLAKTVNLWDKCRPAAYSLSGDAVCAKARGTYIQPIWIVRNCSCHELLALRFRTPFPSLQSQGQILYSRGSCSYYITSLRPDIWAPVSIRTQLGDQLGSGTRHEPPQSAPLVLRLPPAKLNSRRPQWAKIVPNGSNSPQLGLRVSGVS